MMMLWGKNRLLIKKIIQNMLHMKKNYTFALAKFDTPNSFNNFKN